MSDVKGKDAPKPLPNTKTLPDGKEARNDPESCLKDMHGY